MIPWCPSGLRLRQVCMRSREQGLVIHDRRRQLVIRVTANDEDVWVLRVDAIPDALRGRCRATSIGAVVANEDDLLGRHLEARDGLAEELLHGSQIVLPLDLLQPSQELE